MRPERALRGRRLFAGAVVASVLAFVTFAIAQPRRAVRPAAKAPNDERAAPAPGPASAPAAATLPPSDAGVIPAPPSDEAADGGKLSPLNPAPNEFSDAALGATSVDYDRLLADIASLRARVAAVSDTLFHSRIAIAIETDADHGRIADLQVSLDDGVVWSAPAAFRATDETVIYDHAVAPGHHAVTVDVERRDDRNDVFRSTQRSRFIVDVPTDERLFVEVRLWDDSSMGGDFPSDKKGQYELKVRASAKAQPIGR